jgi:hypothetical protein
VSKVAVFKLIQPGTFDDQLTETLRQGGTQPAGWAEAVEAEVADFLAKHADLETENGHQHVVRHGHLPERELRFRIGLIVFGAARPAAFLYRGPDRRLPCAAWLSHHRAASAAAPWSAASSHICG